VNVILTIAAVDHDDNIDNDLDKTEAHEALEEDWKADCCGKDHIDTHQFLDSIFELACTWAPKTTGHASDISNYLGKLYPQIFDVDLREGN